MNGAAAWRRGGIWLFLAREKTAACMSAARRGYNQDQNRLGLYRIGEGGLERRWAEGKR